MSRKIYWKAGLNPRDLQLIMRTALLICDSAYKANNKLLTVTCTGAGNHSPSSLHPWGFAFDIRTYILLPALKKIIFDRIKENFKGTGFQIIWHSTHFHIEYDAVKAKAELWQI